jgi:hypothetical protein
MLGGRSHGHRETGCRTAEKYSNDPDRYRLDVPAGGGRRAETPLVDPYAGLSHREGQGFDSPQLHRRVPRPLSWAFVCFWCASPFSSRYGSWAVSYRLARGWCPLVADERVFGSWHEFALVWVVIQAGRLRASWWSSGTARVSSARAAASAWSSPGACGWYRSGYGRNGDGSRESPVRLSRWRGAVGFWASVERQM